MQTPRIGAAGAGEIERGAMVDRRANDWQPERYIDAAAEARVLENRQSLVVVHRQHAIEIPQPVGIEQRIGRQRAGQLHALAAQLFDYGDDYVDFFTSEVA